MPGHALYSELAEYYDRIYQDKDYAGEAARLLALARRYLGRPPRTLLDVACGTGRHLEYFGRRVAVAGVDASPAMLAVARKRLGPGIRLQRGDMRTFRLRGRFDVIVCLFSAIGYLRRHNDRVRALANLYRHLNAGGVALVEGWILPSRWRGSSVHLQIYDGAEAKIARLSKSTRRGTLTQIEMHYLIGEPGRKIRHIVDVHRNALLEPEEWLASFREAGFRARVLVRPPYQDRGLYVGLRPSLPTRAAQRLRPKGTRGS